MCEQSSVEVGKLYGFIGRIALMRYLEGSIEIEGSQQLRAYIFS